ncbi:MAG TPA: hypothetical protein PK280_18255 [Planctomycetota bacterium]|nr:hypothetical protein [Planctomycetota bacterium]
MIRAGTALLSSALLSAAVALAGEPAPADPKAEPRLEDLVPGNWFGYHAANESVYRHYIVVGKGQKQGEKTVYPAGGIVWVALPDELAIGCAKGQPIQGNWLPRSVIHAQDFTVTLEGTKLTFAGANVRRVFKGGQYNPDTFTGELKRPGVLVGEVTGPKDRHETFHLMREELLTKPPALDLEKGKTHGNLAPLDGGSYHYSLYIPKSYDPAKPMPLLVNCSPGGGAPPLSPKMAEQCGWIMAGLTESKNGPVQPSAENVAAAVFDIRRRLNVDTKRLYWSGFSGGSRLASWCACNFPGSTAGVICMGAGYLPSVGTLPEGCAAFFIVGQTDSNHAEVTGLFPQEKKRRKAEMIIHPGGHSWGRPEDQELAIAWLQALAEGKTPPAVPAPGK